MHSPEATIYCPNPACQAPNPESHRFCQQCRTLIPKRYLWAIAAQSTAWRAGELLAERYWCKQGQVFLDTQPGLLPESPEEIPASVEPYLRLAPLQPNIPSAYALVAAKARSPEVLLLENAPIYPHNLTDAGLSVAEGTLMPELAIAWKQAAALRQLHWLWQAADLWHPLSREGVAGSLLNSTVLRVEGALLRLLGLQYDRGQPATLVNLGQLWIEWLPGARPEISAFLARLCQQLIIQKITTAEHLTSVLDQAIAVCSGEQLRRIEIAALTDQGPTRQRNEDACFPASGSAIALPTGFDDSVSPTANNLIIVCDGIGGHEGGNIASSLAIATVQNSLQSLRSAESTPTLLMSQLEQAALAANDAIAQRNDNEQRYDRQRMGTTLVMAWGQAYELYVAHVGDSRAYRITATGCHQVTLDDDLAAREVRLGYAFQREAVQQPGSGSLVQALGMNSSAVLHPSVQRFVLDEDCVFLLCSDGLSDNDRVEEHWQTVLLPVLQGKQDLAAAASQLVTIANQHNGHDNVTIGLIHCRVIPASGSLPVVPESLATLPAPVDAATTPSVATPSTLKTANLTLDQASDSPARSRPRRSIIALGLLLIAGIGAALTYLLINGVSLFQPEATIPSPTPSEPVAVPTPPSPLATASPVSLSKGSRILVNRSAPDGNAVAPIQLLPQPTASPVDRTSTVPVGSVLEVITERQDASEGRWLGVKVCSLPQSPNLKGIETAKPGALGWVREDTIAPLVTANVSLTKTQLGQCGARN